ncbi:protein of unknown function [Micromonospora pattaloongensis]|uniref:DUF397 domain-containing protein n=1 Tax=Micromonospora pattaloongensis TaxID=405436 RepID=A0A1H3I7I2_9ACTN|nr:DUF397 domain-containing protein [Micromonospora pattaloongensis]SDY23706.1 protein of unknown function [Micromonospora pattaloongensis]
MDLRGVTWRKSTRSSGGGNGDCVEVAAVHDVIAVRDSKQPDGAVLMFDPAGWRTFIDGAKQGAFGPC